MYWTAERLLEYFDKLLICVYRPKIISSEDNLFEKKVVLKSAEGKEYEKSILGGNYFFFVDIPAGSYEITVNGNVYNNIIVEAIKLMRLI